MKVKPKDRALLSWHWSVNSVNGEGFGYSQLRAHLLHPGSSAETLIGHLQLHLPCLGDSQFRNSNEKVLGPNGLIWSSNSLYP